jgi:hypothetical protein
VGSVSTTKACFVDEGGEGVSVGVSGSGFTPGELVFAQIPAPGGLAGFAEATVAPDGTVSATIEHVFPGGIDPVAVPERRQGRPHLQVRQGLGPLRHRPRQIAPLPRPRPVERQVQGPVRRLEEALQEGEPEDRHRPRLDLLATRPNSPQTL